MTLPRTYTQFAVYETFAPTALRGRTVLLAASDELWRSDLPPVLAMECARLGAQLALAAPDRAVYQPVARDIVAYGRPVLELDATTDTGSATFGQRAAAATVQRFERIDLLIAAGPDDDIGLTEAACEAMAAQGAGCAVLIASPGHATAAQSAVDKLHAAYYPRGVRINGVVTAEPAPDASAPSAQEAAWMAIFFASPAGAHLSGQCLSLHTFQL